MNFFSRWTKPRFEPDRIDWLFSHFSWLLANYGGHESFLRSYHLIMPGSKDFPVVANSSAAQVEQIFHSVMRHMGMGTWKVTLVPMTRENSPRTESFVKDTSKLSMGYSSDGVAGYFELDPLRGTRVGYGTFLTSDFTSLVAVLSHEASHYLLTKSITVMPGGWKDQEPVTDLTAIFTGFGLFQANTASVVYHGASGQSASNLGYLPESGRAYALAIFSELSMLDPDFVAKQLRPNPRASYRAAIEDIRKHRWAEMKKLELTETLRDW
jgi:hypothetical protein